MAQGPIEEVSGGAVEGDAPALQGDHSIRGRQAALQPMLPEQHGHAPFLVQAPEQ